MCLHLEGLSEGLSFGDSVVKEVRNNLSLRPVVIDLADMVLDQEGISLPLGTELNEFPSPPEAA